MKKLIFILSLLSTSLSFSQSTYKDSLENVRETTKSTYFDTENKVLSTEDLKHLKEIDYFEPDTSFIVQATWTKDVGRRFKMPTSTDRTPVYRRYGYIHFQIGDTLVRLTVYQNMSLRKKEEYKNYFFIPFRDETSGITTYGGGRYIDVYIYKGETIKTIDFNLCYNPYCAYSHRYSCPIPPEENTIQVSILAGEKTPIYHE